MPQFRRYLLNATDKIVSVDSVEAEDAGGAMVLADYLITKKYPEFAAVEVWQGAKCVGKLLSQTKNPTTLDSLLKAPDTRGVS